MKAGIFLTIAFLCFIAANANAYCGAGYYCEVYDRPSSYYSYERWDGYTSWEYYSPSGRYYSYYGPAYYGYQYNYPYYPAYHYNYYPTAYQYWPSYSYYDSWAYYYSPRFSIGFGW